jgi:alkylated DNA nucleotide flippase Atl1
METSEISPDDQPMRRPATRRLYLQDGHCFDADATVVAVGENAVAFDQTCFYPGGGGQPADEGSAKVVLARKHGATIGRPITTGIFARIAAGAAEEDQAEGKKRITPYWRTLKSGGELNPKYPGGVEDQKARLVAEGHTVLCRGKRIFVQEYERSRVRIRRSPTIGGRRCASGCEPHPWPVDRRPA